MKKRLYGLDILRVISAFIVCAFHTVIHLGAQYGILTDFIRMGAVFMTLFFMLSGYSLFISNFKESFYKTEQIKIYFKKRFISIMPMYWTIVFIYHISIIIAGRGGQTVLLFPIELLGLQSVFESLFTFNHNGGTWFISCILICYLIYPAIQEIVIRLSNKTKVFILLIIAFVLLYAPIVVLYYNLSSIYSNPFFRLLEFIIGVIIASIKDVLDGIELVNKRMYNWVFVLFVCGLMILGVTVAVRHRIGVNNYMLYSWICLPCFIALIISFGGMSFEKMNNNLKEVCLYLSEITYCLFLAQLFSNRISGIIIRQYNINSNLLIVFVGWSVCLMITIFLHGIEKKLKYQLKKKVLSLSVKAE